MTLLEYLRKQADDGALSDERLAEAVAAWERIRAAVPGVMIPSACPGPDDSLLYTWHRGDHHMELELGPDVGCELPWWFYANRADKSNYMPDEPDALKLLRKHFLEEAAGGE